MSKKEVTPTNNEAIKKLPDSDVQLYQAFAQIQRENLLYYKAMKKLNILCTPQFTKAAGGIGYDPRSRKVYMLLNEEQVRSANVKDVSGLCEHEMGHLLYEHIFYDYFVNYQAANKNWMNMAQDYIINENSFFIKSRYAEIKADDKSMLKNICYLEELKVQIPELQGKNSDDLHSIEIYKLIAKFKKEEQKKAKQQQKQQGQSQGQGEQSQDSQDSQGDQESQNGQSGQSGQPSDQQQGKGKNQKSPKGQKSQDKGDNESQSGEGQEDEYQGIDAHGVYEIEVDENGNEVIKDLTDKKDPMEADQIKSDMGKAVKEALVQAIDELKKEGKLEQAVGQLGSHLKKLIKEMIRSKTDKTVILDFVTSLQIGEKRTWLKLNKRFPMINRGKQHLKRPCIVEAIDSSGSMWSEEFQAMIIYQISELVEICDELYIVVGDTAMKWSKKIESRFDFNVETIEFVGSGGTDMNFASEFAESVGADGIVLHTDGDFCRKYDDRGIPTKIFLYGDHAVEVPDFENYRVYPE